MKNNKRILTIFLFLSVFMLFFSCRAPKAEWKGTIEEVNGVTVITNPDEPLYGELVLDLEEDLSIGREDDDNYMFYRIIDIKVDGDRNIYVFERGNLRVQKFDQDGNFLCTIGRKGQGPGEYQRPIELIIDDKRGIIGVKDMMKLIFFDKDGNYLQTIGRHGQGPGEFELPSSVRVDDITGKIFVTDSARFIEIFDKEGNPINSYKLESALRDFRVIEKEENIIGIFKKQADLKIINSICKVNLKGEITNVFAEFLTNQYLKRGQEGETTGIYTGWEKESFISKISSQLFVYGHSDRYLLHVIDKDGKLLQKTQKEVSPQKFTKKIRKRFREWAWGEYKPYFYLILSDSKGRIYVQTNKTWNEEAEEKEIDIFSKDGIYMYKTTLPKNTYLIRDGFLYALEVKKDELIKRYKIKNWSEIKSEIN